MPTKPPKKNLWNFGPGHGNHGILVKKACWSSRVYLLELKSLEWALQNNKLWVISVDNLSTGPHGFQQKGWSPGVVSRVFFNRISMDNGYLIFFRCPESSAFVSFLEDWEIHWKIFGQQKDLGFFLENYLENSIIIVFFFTIDLYWPSPLWTRVRGLEKDWFRIVFRRGYLQQKRW